MVLVAFAAAVIGFLAGLVLAPSFHALDAPEVWDNEHLNVGTDIRPRPPIRFYEGGMTGRDLWRKIVHG